MKKFIGDKPENIFLLLASIFIGISLFVMPVNQVPDESNHARMTWEVLYEKTDDSLDWFNNLNAESKEEYKKLFTEKVSFKNEKLHVNFSVKKIVHIPQLIGMLLGRLLYPSLGVIVLVGRFFNAMLYVIGMYFIIKHAKYGKSVLLFVSLLPIMVQQAASLSYDVANYLTITGFFALLTSLSKTKVLNPKKMFIIALSIFALYITKNNNLLLVLLLFPLGLKLPEKYEKINQRIKRYTEKLLCYKYFLLISFVVILCVNTIHYQSTIEKNDY